MKACNARVPGMSKEYAETTNSTEQTEQTLTRSINFYYNSIFRYISHISFAGFLFGVGACASRRRIDELKLCICRRRPFSCLLRVDATARLCHHTKFDQLCLDWKFVYFVKIINIFSRANRTPTEQLVFIRRIVNTWMELFRVGDSIAPFN